MSDNMPIGGCCSCQEIERMIEQKLQLYLSKGTGVKGAPRKKRAPSERTPRQQCMSDCMRSPEKGGQGKSMAECAPACKLAK